MPQHAGLDKRRDVKLAWEAMNARDFDRLAELMHPHGEFRSVVGQTEGEVYIGIAGLRKWGENIDATWEDFRSDPVEYHDAGEERAVVVARVTGRAKVSGVPLDVVLTQVLTWRDGKLWRNETFADRADALEAAGLSE